MLICLAAGAPAWAQWDCTRAWRTVTSPEPADTVNEILEWNPGDGTRLYVAGFTGTVPGGGRIGAWNGYAWEALGAGVSGGQQPLVDGLAVYENSLIVAGRFSQAGPVSVANVARWTGSEWQALGAGIPTGALDLGIFDLHVHGGELFAAGDGIGGAGYVHRWDGNAWQALPAPPGTSWAISYALASHDGALHCVVSNVSNSQSAVYRWDGTGWVLIGNSVIGGPVYALAPFQGNLYIAGRFPPISGTSSGGIAFWDGAAWRSVGTGFLAQAAYFLHEYAGELFVGGEFSRVNGSVCPRLAAWDGLQWRCVGVSGAFTYDATVYRGELVVGGAFGGGGAPRNLTRFGRQIFPVDIDQDFDVDLSDLALLLARFGTISNPPLPGDADGDGDVDLSDLALMLSYFGQSCS